MAVLFCELTAGCAPEVTAPRPGADSAGSHQVTNDVKAKAPPTAIREFPKGTGAAFPSSSTKPPGPRIDFRFENVASTVGTRFQYDNGATGRELMVEATGGGAAWLDYDQDGQLDMFFVQGGFVVADPGQSRPSDQLYRCLDRDGYVDVTTAAAISDGEYGQGVSAADFDNDGFPDLYVTNFGANQFLRNQGDGTFQEISREAGLRETGWSSSAAWGDLDCDGDLDLYVCKYVVYDPLHTKLCTRIKSKQPAMCHPRDFEPVPDECFENLGDGTFRRVTKAWRLEGPGNRGLGVAIADFNNDGWPDIFVANDTTANFLFLSHQGRHFEESATLLGCALSSAGLAQANMGVAVGDYDRNGYLDLYITHFYGEWNTLYRNLGPEGFQDRTTLVGLAQPPLAKLGFGTVMADFNLDGLPELFVANGNINAFPDGDEEYAMAPQLFSFTGDRWFEQVPAHSDYFQSKSVGRGVALGDADDDGDMDLLVVHQNSPAAFLRNQSPRGHWLKLQLIGRKSNRSAIGTRVVLRRGGTSAMQEIAGGTSYCSGHDVALVFGLGDSTAACEVEIRWPTGLVQHLPNLHVDQTLQLLEPLE